MVEVQWRMMLALQKSQEAGEEAEGLPFTWRSSVELLCVKV